MKAILVIFITVISLCSILVVAGTNMKNVGRKSAAVESSRFKSNKLIFFSNKQNSRDITAAVTN